jgi:AraC family transcriptional regulator of adaptative response/methylated-DNA-[protein]-cysteine methyltransferase
MDDYQKMSTAIQYMTDHVRQQPSLREMANAAGLSPYYFQKKFKSWVGVTPKVFLQYLTLAEAKQYLAEGNSIMDATIQSGLSGPGRLHDLCIKIRAATPGEIKSGGQGMDLYYGYGPSPFGECLLGYSRRGICFLSFIPESGRDEALRDLKMAWPGARLVLNEEQIHIRLREIFQDALGTGQAVVHAYVKGSNFQIKVWEALLRIPEGVLVSYGKLAAHLGQAHGARAVGSAVAANNIAYLIPCHRVIRNTGVIGDYRWGSDRKRKIIAFESARRHKEKLTEVLGTRNDLAIDQPKLYPENG